MTTTFGRYVGKISSRFDPSELMGQLSSVPQWLDAGQVLPLSDGRDQVLKTVAARIAGVLRDSDTISRVGGDEFVTVLSNVRSKEDVSLVANKICLLYTSDAADE